MPKSSVESKPKPLNTAFFVVSKGDVGNVSIKSKYLNKPSRGNAYWRAAKLKLLFDKTAVINLFFQSGNI